MRKKRADQATAYSVHRRFPDWLVTNWSPPHRCCIVSTARRCVQSRKPHAMRYATGRCARHAAARPDHYARNGIFCFRNVSRQRWAHGGYH
uniref:Uncharacterized protein n=1 Tax=Burkholderia orbicola (strain AU 1054) TaxID=331271 RepID=A0A0H2XVB2_BURO1